MIRRILEKWDSIVEWYHKLVQAAIEKGKEPPFGFPLTADKTDLIQVLSILDPITEINRMSQQEAPNQVVTLTKLFWLRMTTLDVTKRLKDYPLTTAFLK